MFQKQRDRDVAVVCQRRFLVYILLFFFSPKINCQSNQKIMHCICKTHTRPQALLTRIFLFIIDIYIYIYCKILYYLKDISVFECSVYTKFSTPLCTSTYNGEEEEQIDGADDRKKNHII